MEELFRAALITSCAGGALTLVLLALRPVTSKIFGSVWQYYIYLAALAVFIIPISFGRSYSPFPESVEPAEVAQFAPAETIVTEPPQADTVSEIETAPVPAAEERRAEIWGIRLTDILKYVWLVGIAVFLAGAAVSYARFLRLIRKNSRVTNCAEFEEIKAAMGIRRNIAVKASTMLDAPLMVGVFRPALILPDSKIGESELRYIVMHELTHFKRRDLLYKWFAMIVNAIHWFNPLVYLLIRRINEDCEISCDVTVTKNFSEEEKKEYMRTIVNLMKG